MERYSRLIKNFTWIIASLLIMTPAMVHAAPGIIEVDLNGTPVNVDYDAEGVEVLGNDIDSEFISIFFDVEVTGSPGILEITLERNFLDSIFDGLDEPFIIIFDGGEEPNFEEISTTSESRTLRIELPEGTTDVEILGTQFGVGDALEDDDSAEEAAAKAAEEAAAKAAEEAAAKAAEEAAAKAAEEAAAKAAEEEAAAKAAEEAAKTTTLPTQCGPGTVLKDGACVLDQSCGPGTILQDGVCVIDATEKKPVGNNRDLAMGIGAAFVIAFIVMIILWLIGKAGKDRSPTQI